ncbi:MAG TPA: glutamine-hydrolyzing GMP synthase, partial [Thermodesulfobacteriota bacterium]|nr:glutamine-hydrolyzing GMP synthase [Thermodesulfobacteriota bacterium]
MRETILVLDFGSQYTQLIARRIRELGVYSEIKPYSTPLNEIERMKPKAIILSGGPASVWDDDSPTVDREMFSLGIPVLGICYGMQLTAQLLGGVVEHSKVREFGPATLEITNGFDLLSGIPDKSDIWMSHGDRVLELPPGFESIAGSENSPMAAMKNLEMRIYGT